jgi:hypothetical protein
MIFIRQYEKISKSESGFTLSNRTFGCHIHYCFTDINTLISPPKGQGTGKTGYMYAAGKADYANRVA